MHHFEYKKIYYKISDIGKLLVLSASSYVQLYQFEPILYGDHIFISIKFKKGVHIYNKKAYFSYIRSLLMHLAQL